MKRRKIRQRVLHTATIGKTPVRGMTDCTEIRAREREAAEKQATARAREVLAHEDSALVAAVKSGEIAVAAAAALSRNQAAASPDHTSPSFDSAAASANEGSTPAGAPSPSANTMVETPTVATESPSSPSSCRSGEPSGGGSIDCPSKTDH